MKQIFIILLVFSQSLAGLGFDLLCLVVFIVVGESMHGKLPV